MQATLDNIKRLKALGNFRVNSFTNFNLKLEYNYKDKDDLYYLIKHG